MSSAKISSSVLCTGNAARTPIPASTSAFTAPSVAASIAATLSAFDHDAVIANVLPSRATFTFVTPSVARTIPSAFAASPVSRSVIAGDLRSRRSSDVFPSATSFPFAMTTTRLQLDSTSLRMCVESSTV